MALCGLQQGNDISYEVIVADEHGSCRYNYRFCSAVYYEDKH